MVQLCTPRTALSALGMIRTYDTLLSRQSALPTELPVQLTIQHQRKENLKQFCGVADNANDVACTVGSMLRKITYPLVVGQTDFE